MLYILRTQQKRGYGSILFDHNAENVMKMSVHTGEVTYRRNEFKLRRRMFVFAILYLGLKFVTDLLRGLSKQG